MITENSVSQDTFIYCRGCCQEVKARTSHHQLKKWCSAGCAQSYKYRKFKSKESIYRKEYSLTKFHGMTFDDYDERLELQGGKCALCNKLDQGRNLAVDHDHQTNRNRGLLCRMCNLKLGYLEQDLKWPAKAMAYLYHYKSFPGKIRPPARRWRPDNKYPAQPVPRISPPDSTWGNVDATSPILGGTLERTRK